MYHADDNAAADARGGTIALREHCSFELKNFCFLYKNFSLVLVF